LERQGINPFRSLAFKQSEVWPTADWRLTGINKANHHCWPDAAELLDWMERKSDELDGEKLNLLNQRLKSMFFDVATSDAARNWIGRFRRVAKPFRIRVEWYFDDLPLDAVIG
jgi:hypothetical protein